MNKEELGKTLELKVAQPHQWTVNDFVYCLFVDEKTGVVVGDFGIIKNTFDDHYFVLQLVSTKQWATVPYESIHVAGRA